MKYLLFSLLLLGLSDCSSTKSATTATTTTTEMQLAGTNWTLEAFQASEGKMTAALNNTATLMFDQKGGIGGNTGCNSMGGDYAQKGNQLTIQAFSTKMYCQEVAAQENAINSVMQSTMTVSLEKDRLTLRSKGGQLVYGKAKKPAPPVNGNTPATDMGNDREPRQYDGGKPVGDTKFLAGQVTRVDGLFRYMADAAGFTRCSDNQRFAVSTSGAYREAEAAYLKMNKSGAPAYMVFEAEAIKNPGEGHPQMIVIKKVVSASTSENCPG
jgi:heat shock protein HslJ